MFNYQLAGLEIESDLELPLLPGKSQKDCLIVRAERLTKTYQFRELGQGIAVAYDTEKIIYKFQNRYQFIIEDKLISYQLLSNSSESSEHLTDYVLLKHFMLNQILPLVLSRKQIVIHASAVLVSGQVFAFCGTSGAGKSTVAQRLLSEGQFLADDYLPLSLYEDKTKVQAMVQSTYPAYREFSEQGYKEQKLLDETSFYRGSLLPLNQIFFLNRAEGCIKPDCRLITQDEAFDKLLRQIYVLDPGDDQQQMQVFRSLSMLVENLEFYELSYSDFDKESFLLEFLL